MTEQASSAESGSTANVLVRWLAGGLANVTVLTALLVYFGWQRSEMQARRMGIDESILGMSTRDYLLRSVRPVLVLLLIFAVAGFLWLRLDSWLIRRLHADARDRWVRYALWTLPFAWLILPAVVWALGYVWPAHAFIALPLSIGAGVLLAMYGGQVRAMLPDARAPLPGRDMLMRAFTAVVVGVTLFWGASNYAVVLGEQLARDFRVERLTKVVVYSPQRLHLTAPGITETPLAGDKSAYRYRYDGIRLMEHTGGRYFLISEGWTPATGW